MQNNLLNKMKCLNIKQDDIYGTLRYIHIHMYIIMPKYMFIHHTCARTPSHTYIYIIR